MNMEISRVIMDINSKDFLLDRLSAILHNNHCQEYTDEICKAFEKYIVPEPIKLKPFNLEAAKAGHPVCTRDGRKARIICFDRYNRQLRYIVALVTESTGLEELYTYTLEGKISCNEKSDHDLVMASEKKIGWINIYPQINITHIAETSEGVYPTEAVAKLYAQADCIATVPIEWEE